METNERAERAAQHSFARRMGDDAFAARRPPLTVKKAFVKNTPKPSGHEAFLKALESSNATVEVEKASSGERVVGKIKASDKYTISLRVPFTANDWDGPYATRVIFKHDISEFMPIIMQDKTAGTESSGAQ